MELYIPRTTRRGSGVLPACDYMKHSIHQLSRSGRLSSLVINILTCKERVRDVAGLKVA